MQHAHGTWHLMQRAQGAPAVRLGGSDEEGTPTGMSGPSETLGLASGELFEHWRSLLHVETLDVGDPCTRDSLKDATSKSKYSLYSRIPSAEKRGLVARIKAECPRDPVAKAVGSMIGMAAADATGHWFEFMRACDTPGENGVEFDVSKLAFVPGSFAPNSRDAYKRPDRPACFLGGHPFNKFFLQLGQWTDDCAMGLCLADSLLVSAGYDGSDLRVRFWNWWHRGYCNAFSRDQSAGARPSVGLGGNISKSIYSMAPGETPTPRFEASGEDSGNGSLMRLAPVPIYFCHSQRAAGAGAGVEGDSDDRDSTPAGELASFADDQQAQTVLQDMAAESSLTTHPGAIAAEACAFFAFLIGHAIQDPSLPLTPEEAAEGGAGKWLHRMAVETYLPLLTARATEAGQLPPGVEQVARLILAAESDDSTERNWNWRCGSEGLQIAKTIKRRNGCYNGHPVSFEYFGAYSIDGLAIALHSVYSTLSFDSAVERCINFLGDADSTGSMAGQLAGSIYGVAAINSAFVDNLQQWDDGEVAVRGYMLFHAGQQAVHGGAASAPLETPNSRSAA
eukprot:COSAG05_NODE_253_length_12854_cov_23.790200_2_plen_564_part_00